MKFYNRIIVFTSSVFLFCLASVIFLKMTREPHPISIEISGHITIGDYLAPVRMVVFEDLKCENCREFHEQIFPDLKRKYIDTKKVSLTIIPIAFLDGSEQLANVLLSIYFRYPDHFLAYLEKVEKSFSSHHSDWDSKEKLLEYAEEVGTINSIYIEACLKMGKYLPEIRKNFALAERAMGKNVATPTLYINGIATSASNIKAINRRIEKILRAL